MEVYNNTQYGTSINNNNITLKFDITSSDNTFNVSLTEKIPLTENTDIFLESITTKNCLSKDNINRSNILLKLDNLNISTSTTNNNSNLDSITYMIGNLSTSDTSVTTHNDEKRFNYLTTVTPVNLKNLSGKIMFLDGSSITSGTCTCIIELLLISSNILHKDNKNNNKKLSINNNTQYINSLRESKNIVLKTQLGTSKNFNINLQDKLIISKKSEIFLNSVILQNTKCLDVYGYNSNFLLKFDDLNIKNKGTNSIVNEGINIPNIEYDGYMYTTDNFRTGILDRSLGDDNSKLHSYGGHFPSHNTTHINTGFGNRTADPNNVNEMSIDLTLTASTTVDSVVSDHDIRDHHYEVVLNDITGVEKGMAVTSINGVSYTDIFVLDLNISSKKVFIYSDDSSLTITGTITFAYTEEQISNNLRLFTSVVHTGNTSDNYPGFLLIPNPLNTLIDSGENNHPTFGLKDSITVFLKNLDPPNSWWQFGVIHKGEATSWEHWYTTNSARDHHGTYNNKIVLHSSGVVIHGGHKLDDQSRFKYNEELLSSRITDTMDFKAIHNRIVLDNNFQNETAGSGLGQELLNPQASYLFDASGDTEYKPFFNYNRGIYIGLTIDYIENNFLIEVDSSDNEKLKLLNYTFSSDDHDESELIYEGMHIEYLSGEIPTDSSILNYSFINTIDKTSSPPTFTVSTYDSLTSDVAFTNKTFTLSSKMVIKIFGQILRFRWHPRIDSSSSTTIWSPTNGATGTVSSYNDSNVKKVGPDHIVLPRYHLGVKTGTATASDIELTEGWAIYFGDTGSADSTEYALQLADSSEIPFISEYQRTTKKTNILKNKSTNYISSVNPLTINKISGKITNLNDESISNSNDCNLILDLHVKSKM